MQIALEARKSALRTSFLDEYLPDTLARSLERRNARQHQCPWLSCGALQLFAAKVVVDGWLYWHCKHLPADGTTRDKDVPGPAALGGCYINPYINRPPFLPE